MPKKFDRHDTQHLRNLGTYARQIEAIYQSAEREAAAVGAAPGTGLACPVCGSLVRKYDWGWGCTGFKTDCKFSLSATVAGKKITDKQAEEYIKTGKTPVIKGFKGKKGKFDARLVYSKTENKADFVFKNNAGENPKNSYSE